MSWFTLNQYHCLCKHSLLSYRSLYYSALTWVSLQLRFWTDVSRTGAVWWPIKSQLLNTELGHFFMCHYAQRKKCLQLKGASQKVRSINTAVSKYHCWSKVSPHFACAYCTSLDGNDKKHERKRNNRSDEGRFWMQLSGIINFSTDLNEKSLILHRIFLELRDIKI